jgi:uncharacterized protein
VTGGHLPAPEPVVNAETAPFWDAAADERLVLPRCRSCGGYVWYPRAHCPACHGTDLEWVEVSGRGRIYSFSIVRRAREDWADVTPFALAYVELDEGPRVMTNVVTDDPGSLEVDQVVEVVFHRTPSGRALPRFRPC